MAGSIDIAGFDIKWSIPLLSTDVALVSREETCENVIYSYIWVNFSIPRVGQNGPILYDYEMSVYVMVGNDATQYLRTNSKLTRTIFSFNIASIINNSVDCSNM